MNVKSFRTLVVFTLIALFGLIALPVAPAHAATTRTITVTDTAINSSRLVAGRTYGAFSVISVKFNTGTTTTNFNYKLNNVTYAVASVWSPTISADGKTIKWSLVSATINNVPARATVIAQINATYTQSVSAAVQAAIKEALARYGVTASTNYQITQIGLTPGKLMITVTY